MTTGIAVRLALAALVLFLTGCRASLTPLQRTVELPGVARVVLTEVKKDIFKFDVFNLTSEGMVILRDEVVLATPGEIRRRTPGGRARIYNLPPGGAHDVNVRFDLKDLDDGSIVEVRFDRALLVGSQPIPIAPVAFRVGD